MNYDNKVFNVFLITVIICLALFAIFCLVSVIGACQSSSHETTSSTAARGNADINRFDVVEEWEEDCVRHEILKDNSTNLLYYITKDVNGYRTFSPYYADKDSVMTYDKYVQEYKDK